MRKLNYKIYNYISPLNLNGFPGSDESAAFAALMSSLTKWQKVVSNDIFLTDPSWPSSFWVFFWGLWLWMNMSWCVFLPPWSPYCTRVHQWARPSLDGFFWIWEVCGAEWNIRRIKNRIDVIWRTQRIAKCSILVWRRKLLTLTLCICMCY